MIWEAAERVGRMERYLDTVQEALGEKPDALREDASLRAMVEALAEYYAGGEWLRDYELDERGLLPPDLKRGVLAQDTLYDFFERVIG